MQSYFRWQSLRSGKYQLLRILVQLMQSFQGQLTLQNKESFPKEAIKLPHWLLLTQVFTILTASPSLSKHGS